MFAALAAGVAFANCGGGDGPTAPPPAAVASVVVAGLPTESVIVVGSTAQLSASPRSATGATLDRPVTWTSTDNNTATVSATGLVTGVAAGPVTIRATSEGVSSDVPLSIRAPIVVPPASAGAPVTTTVLGGAVTLTIPPAATATTTQLTVAPTSRPPTDTRVVAGATFDFGPAGTTFTTPITMSLAFNPATVPVAKRQSLRIYQVLANGSLELLPNGSVDLANNRVEAPVSHFSTYTVVQQPDPATITFTAGQGQQAQFGTAVAVAPAVTVRDAQGRGVALVEVSFAATAGGGSVTGSSTAVTNADGVATLAGEWVLGPQSGANELTATVAGTSLVAQLSATATAPAAQLFVLSEPTDATAGTPFTVIVQVRDEFGNLVPTAANEITAAMFSGSGLLGGVVTATAVDGVATFNNLQLRGAGIQRLQFTSPGLASAQTGSIVLTQTPTSLAVTLDPDQATSGAPFGVQPRLHVLDAVGDRVLGSTASVTARVFSGSGALFGTTTVNAVDGIVDFTNLAIEGSGAHVLEFTSAGLSSASSVSFTVGDAAPGVRLRVGAAPTASVTAGNTIAIPLLVDLANRGSDDLASLTVTVTWDPTKFTFSAASAGAWTDTEGDAALLVVNDGNTASGSFRISGLTANATTSGFTLYTITLTATGSGSGSVQATVDAAGNAAGADITVLPRPLAVTIAVP